VIYSFNAGLSNLDPGRPLSCRVQLQPQLNPCEPASQALNYQAGAKLYRTVALLGWVWTPLL